MIRILHAADLHLDSPFSALSPEQAAQRRGLQRRLPGLLADLCLDRGCDLLLLAGDVFDGRRVSPETVEALKMAFARCRVPVFIAPGNHDPYTGTSPWALTAWPENVHIFTGAPASVTLPDLGCRVWGGGFTAAACDGGLPPVVPGGLLEIGVYHGDPETPGPYRAISRGDLEQCGLDYLALGHIHRTQLPKQAGRTWYGWPGVTLGRGFDECGTHGVFLTDLDRSSCKTEFLPIPGPRYEAMTVPYGQTPRLPADSGNVICRLTVTGEADEPDFDALRRALEPHFLALDLRDETVPVRDLWSTCGDGSLRGTALEILKRRFDEGDQQTAALAARYVLAALEGRDAP